MTNADKIVVLCAVFFVMALYATLWQKSELGGEVSILVNGQQQYRVSLMQDKAFDVQGALGLSHIEIKSGAVRFFSSPCTNKQCVHRGWLRQAGDFMACLPNKVSFYLLGTTQGYDAINF